MTENDYASKEWGEKLGWLFPDAEYHWNDYCWGQVDLVYGISDKHAEHYPAISISISMALDVLPPKYKEGWITVQKNYNKPNYEWMAGYWGAGYTTKLISVIEFIDKHLPTALCKMIEYLVNEGVIKKGGNSE